MGLTSEARSETLAAAAAGVIWWNTAALMEVRDEGRVLRLDASRQDRRSTVVIISDF